MYYFMAKDYSHKRKSKRLAQKGMKDIRHQLQLRLKQGDVTQQTWSYQRLNKLLQNLPDGVIL